MYGSVRSALETTYTIGVVAASMPQGGIGSVELICGASC